MNLELSAGPLEKTVDDFWLMVWQQQSSVIVMLCNLVEAAREKSYQYWPLEVGHTMVLGEVRQAVALGNRIQHPRLSAPYSKDDNDKAVFTILVLRFQPNSSGHGC